MSKKRNGLYLELTEPDQVVIFRHYVTDDHYDWCATVLIWETDAKIAAVMTAPSLQVARQLKRIMKRCGVKRVIWERTKNGVTREKVHEFSEPSPPGEPCLRNP